MKQPLEKTQVVVLVALSVLLFALVLVFFLGGGEEKIRQATQVPPEPQSQPESLVLRKKVILYFASEVDDWLHPEEREVEVDPSSPASQATRVLEELVKGSNLGYVSALPTGTRVRQVYITKDGTAYADFSKELSDNHPSGTSAEMTTVYAVVNTLANNFRDIRRVCILVDGAEKETLGGHVVLNRPLLPSNSLVAQ